MQGDQAQKRSASNPEQLTEAINQYARQEDSRVYRKKQGTRCSNESAWSRYCRRKRKLSQAAESDGEVRE